MKLTVLLVITISVAQVLGQCLQGPPGPQGLAGRDGRDGKNGEKGDKGDSGLRGLRGFKGEKGSAGIKSGGALYTRWGRTTCPETPETETVYSGIVAASHHMKAGGGANYLCLPDDPRPLESTAGTHFHRATIYGVEYDFTAISSNSLTGIRTHNAPCAVCYTSQRATLLTMPAKPTCPDSSWTLEYAGYLVAERANHFRVMFECMDKEPECVSGSVGWIAGFGAFLTLTEVPSCGVGIPCPPYSNGMELSCAVCTK